MHEKTLRAAEKALGVTPPALLSQPDVNEDQLLYLRGFNTLSRTRNVAMQQSPITLQEMSAYCEVYNVHDREAFIEIVTAMDAAYLEKRGKREQASEGTE